MHSAIRKAFQVTLNLFPSSTAVQLHYTVHHKRLPNLKEPKRFTEKVIRRKLLDRDPRLPLRADKLAVKSFVALRIGDDYVTPTLWSGTQLPSIEDLTSMVPFVLKSNHGSAANAFIRSADDIDLDSLRRRSSAWLMQVHAAWAA